jgi:[ribosomal protein S5]-alanine N-acetyltransferase
MRTLATDRLQLEPQLAAHADEMFVVLSDPAIYEFENHPPPSAAWLRARYAGLESRRSADGRDQWLNWVLRLHTGELIGYFQASIFAGGAASIAYELSSTWWGKGLAHEAADCVMAELAGHYRVHRLSAVLKAGNHRSRRLLERLGMRIASAQTRTEANIAAGELRMVRDACSPSSSSYQP